MSKTTVNPYQKLKNEKISKIEFIFAKNSATLFCEVSRCCKLVKNDVLDPKNAPKNFGTFRSFPYPLLGVHFFKKKKKFVSKTTVNPYQKLKNEKIPKIEFIFAKNSATLFCEVSRCCKLVKNDGPK